MRILIYNWKDLDHPAAGGAEVLTHEVAKRWVADGHSVTQFCSRFPGSDEQAERDGVQIVRRGGRFGVYREAKGFWRENEGKFDVVIDEINTRPFMTPKFVRGVPIVALIHQLAAEVWNEEMPLPVALLGRYVLEPKWLRAYRSVPTVTVSESTRADLERLGFRDVSVIPEGLTVRPLSELPAKEAHPTLLFVGRLVRTKRPGDTLTAFRHIRRTLPDARLWVVGDGYMRGELKKAAPEGVTFFGQVDEATKLSLMSRAHVLLVPGVREGWGLVVTEANAMGTPAVGYDIPGLRDSILAGETGMLVPTSPSAMAVRGTALLQDPSQLTRLAQSALQWAQTFDWDKTASTLMTKASRCALPTPATDVRAETGAGTA